MTRNIRLMTRRVGVCFGMMIPLVAVAQDGGGDPARTKPVKTRVNVAGKAKQTRQDILTNRKLADDYKPLADLDTDSGGKDRSFGLVQTPPRNPLSTKGLTENTSEDLDRAIARDTQAITDRPEKGALYIHRANLRYARGDFGGTADDCSRAIQIEAVNPIPYWLRGRAKYMQGDADKALSDFDRAVALDPNAPYNYVGRSAAKRLKADYQGALADADRAVKLASTDAAAYAERAYGNCLTGHLQEALSDFRSCCQWSETHQEYPRLFIWLIQKRLGYNEAADAELAGYLDQREKVPSREWPAIIGEFLLGKRMEDDLFASALSPVAAKQGDQRCEANYYSAMKKLLDGDKAGAIDHFRRCLDTRRSTFVESQFAAVELNALSP